MKKLRKYKGISPRGDHIQIAFTLYSSDKLTSPNRRETYPHPPTQSNMERAFAKRQGIIDKCRVNEYHYEDYRRDFPNSGWLKEHGKRVLPTNILEMTVNEMLDQWYQKKVLEIDPSSMDPYMNGVRFIKATIGERDISSIHLIDIEKLIIAMRKPGVDKKPWKTNTIRDRVSPLRQAFKMYRSVLSGSPFEDFELVTPSDEDETEADPFELSEMNELLDHTDGVYKTMATLGFGLGLRQQEIFALAVDDYDPHGHTLSINRAVVKGRFKSPKTKTSRRTIDLTAFVWVEDAIKAHLRNHLPIRWDTKYHGVKKLMFSDPSAKVPSPFLDTQNFRKYWIDLCEPCDIRYRPAGQMRHTFGSNQIALGADPLIIAGIMGHKNTQMLDKHYKKQMDQAAKIAGRAPKDFSDVLKDLPTRVGRAKLRE